MIRRVSQVDDLLFSRILHIWIATGIANPARADDQDTVNRTLAQGGMIFLAFRDEEMVGTCWLTHDHRRTYIHHMAVLPELHDQGIGKELLNAALDYSRELGLQAKLEVHETNLRGIYLYQSMGFAILEGYYSMIKRDIAVPRDDCKTTGSHT